jgi:hypothetical protein
MPIDHFKIDLILLAMKGIKQMEQDINGLEAKQNNHGQKHIDAMHAMLEGAKDNVMCDIRSLNAQELVVLGTHTGAFEGF